MKNKKLVIVAVILALFSMCCFGTFFVTMLSNDNFQEGFQEGLEDSRQVTAEEVSVVATAEPTKEPTDTPQPSYRDTVHEISVFCQNAMHDQAQVILLTEDNPQLKQTESWLKEFDEVNKKMDQCSLDLQASRDVPAAFQEVDEYLIKAGIELAEAQKIFPPAMLDGDGDGMLEAGTHLQMVNYYIGKATEKLP